MFYLKNLSSSVINTGVLPWDFRPSQPIPEEVRKNKKLRDIWINTPATNHHVYTFFEGTNSNLRVSRPRTDGLGNPPYCAHALVADYDSDQPREKVLEYARSLPYPPNWIECTLSGNWRYIWLLEEKLLWPSFDFCRHFLKKFSEFAFDPARGMVGFDKGAWEAPERLWTNSCDWQKLSDAKIPADVTRGWLVKASATYNFTEREFGTAIPLDTVKAELEKKYPKFREWGGDFTLNSQGPTFWVDQSASPKSAVVRETGMQTFSAHAPKGFFSWADLLGADFVREFEAAAIGRAVEGIYYDGKKYWRKSDAGIYRESERQDAMLYIRAARGLTNKPDKAGVSLVERAILYIQNSQRVESASPFIYQPSGLLYRNGKCHLNICSTRVLQPADGVAVWGPDGQFPWLSKFMDLIPDEHARLVVLAWLAWGYRHAYHLDPVSGQVLFLAGPVGVGKTLFNRAVVGALFGGFMEAGAFLTGTDNFNAEMFHYGHWVLDDGSVGAGMDARRKRYYTETIKRIAANPTFRSNGKFLQATLTEWQGRLGISCNADEESLMQLPETTISNLDKIILVRTSHAAPVKFPLQAEIKRILEKELPWFGRHLLDWKIPEDLMGDSRFGIKAYADSTLVETSRQSSRGAGFREILDDWIEGHFRVREPEATKWEGTAFQLHKAILLSDPAVESAMRNYPVDMVSVNLMTIHQKGFKGLECASRGEKRIWTINKIAP
jgi:hypothetical protein